MEPFKVRATGWTRWMHWLACVAGWHSAPVKDRNFCAWMRYAVAGGIMLAIIVGLVGTIWIQIGFGIHNRITADPSFNLFERIMYPTFAFPVLVLAILLVLAAVIGIVAGGFMLYQKVRRRGVEPAVKEPPQIVRAFHAWRDRYCTGIEVEERKK